MRSKQTKLLSHVTNSFLGEQQNICGIIVTENYFVIEFGN